MYENKNKALREKVAKNAKIAAEAEKFIEEMHFVINRLQDSILQFRKSQKDIDAESRINQEHIRAEFENPSSF